MVFVRRALLLNTVGGGLVILLGLSYLIYLVMWFLEPLPSPQIEEDWWEDGTLLITNSPPPTWPPYSTNSVSTPTSITDR